jgi:capsular exopolysaccharide synthesis family protein
METPQKNTPQPEIKLHFLDYWRIIRIRKTVILAVFLLVVITTTLVTMFMPEKYASTVRIEVGKDVPDVELWEARPIQQGHDPYFLQTEFEKIRSKSVLYPVISNLNLQVVWARDYGLERLKLDEAYSLLRGHIDVRPTRNTQLIEITVLSKDNQESAIIANAIAEAYRNYRTEQRQQVTRIGIESLRQRLEEEDKKVREAQLELGELREELEISDFGNLSMGQVATTEADMLRGAARAKIEAETQHARNSSLLEDLMEMTRQKQREAIPTAFPDPLLKDLLQNLYITENDLVNKRKNLADEHPDILRTQAMLDSLNRQIDARVEGILTGLNSRVEADQAMLVKLEEQLEDARDREMDMAKKVQLYAMQKQDLEDDLRIRSALALRITQEEVKLEIPTTQIVSVVDMAEPEERAVQPNKPLNIALGIIVGIAVGVGLAFFIEYLDTSVKTIDDVERALQAPVLGVIPQNVGSLLDEGPESPHAEAYRVLRTNILFSRKDEKLNTVTIVSAGAGEGKSTTLFNLAVIFALNGHRVLIVDSDLRRPSLHKLLKVSNSLGLTNFLLKQNSLEEVIQTSHMPTLDFMPSGKLPSSSMGILSSSQMKELIRDLKKRYDFVFFDSPPIMGVSDASILASEVDMALQVIQYRRYPQPMTIRAKQMIEKVGGNLVGIVLNNINMAQDENYYYYSGYYYDYYSKHDSDSNVEAEGKDPKKPRKEKGEGPAVEIKQKF